MTVGERLYRVFGFLFLLALLIVGIAIIAQNTSPIGGNFQLPFFEFANRVYNAVLGVVTGGLR